MRSFRMAFNVTTVIMLIAIAVSGPSLAAQQKAAATEYSAVVNGNNEFAISLFHSISSDHGSDGKNIFVSPFSVSSALAMTYAGARGNTQKQMANVLHFNAAGQDLNGGFSSLLGKTKAAPGKGYKLEVANALWGQKDYHFEDTFTSTVGKYYDGGFNTVDFVAAREDSRGKINKWVEEKTADKIKELVHKNDVGDLTRLILTNAIYFKGDWISKFKPEDTKPSPFHASQDRVISVAMMQQSAKFPVLETSELRMVELPYAGNDVSMLVILPEGDIEKLGAELSLDKLNALRKQLVPSTVRLFLPRYKFETRYYLEEQLGKMGMPDAFSESAADFSGMTGKPNLYISHVIHQAMIDVNEQGSEAAAATAVIMETKSLSMPVTFRADKPFVFVIVHKPTDSILFIGRVSEPPIAAGDAK